MKSNIGKWVKIGMSKEDRESQYQRLRAKAKTILKNNHQKEYLNIIKNLLEKELKEIKKNEQGN
jgi:hypothetical protein